MSELRFRNGEARFPWQQTREVLRALLAEHPDLQPDDKSDKNRSFLAQGVRFTPPLVQRIREPHTHPTSYLHHLPEGLGTHLVLLLQAGAAALGIFQQGELTHHKVIKKYVVRGRGRAQPTHLRTRGKSRYGSRLRLQNYQRLLAEVNERLQMWHQHDDVPDIDDRFFSCAVRTWSDLFHQKPPPPYPRTDWTRIPLDVHVPGLDELLRTWRALCQGTVSLPESPGPGTLPG